jgi:hypothetical protein
VPSNDAMPAHVAPPECIPPDSVTRLTGHARHGRPQSRIYMASLSSANSERSTSTRTVTLVKIKTWRRPRGLAQADSSDRAAGSRGEVRRPSPVRAIADG